MKVNAAMIALTSLAAFILQLSPEFSEAAQWQRHHPLSVGVILGHFAHWSWDHLMWDLMAFLILGISASRLLPTKVIPSLVISSVAIPLEIYLFQTHLDTYRGLSGLDCALFGLIIAALWNGGRFARLLAIVALVVFLGKTIFELSSAQTLFVSNGDFVPVPSAHLIGLLIGVLSGMTGSVLTFR